MPDNQQEREAYYAKIGKLDVSALWTTRLVPPRPKKFGESGAVSLGFRQYAAADALRGGPAHHRA